MAKKTHTLPDTTPRRSFDIKAVTLFALTNANAKLPGRGQDENGQQRKRSETSPVLFNPTGRGANAYTLVAAMARKFGHTPTLQELADIITEAGYTPSWAKDNKSFRVVPVIGAVSKSAANVEQMADDFFGDMFGKE